MRGSMMSGGGGASSIRRRTVRRSEDSVRRRLAIFVAKTLRRNEYVLLFVNAAAGEPGTHLRVLVPHSSFERWPISTS